MCFRLDHQHRGFCAGHDHVQRRVFERCIAWVQEVLTVYIANPSRSNRAFERNTGQCQRRRRSDQSRDVRIMVFIRRQNGWYDLDFVHEALRKQRPNGPVYQPTSQGFLLGGSTFTTKEATRDLAGGIGLLLIVDSQWEERLSRPRRFGTNDRGQHYGIANRYQG